MALIFAMETFGLFDVERVRELYGTG